MGSDGPQAGDEAHRPTLAEGLTVRSRAADHDDASRNHDHRRGVPLEILRSERRPSRALTRVDTKLEHRDFAVVVGASCGGVEAMQKLGMAETKNS
jgi:chemotaxis response regulator CheB